MYKLILLFLIPLLSLGQASLFSLSQEKHDIVTHNVNNTIFLDLNTNIIDHLNNDKPCTINLKTPFLNDQLLSLQLEYFEVISSDFQLAKSTEKGIIYDNYLPQTISYRIVNDNNLSGSISIFKNTLMGVIKISGEVFEIVKIKNNTYALFQISDALTKSSFFCQTETGEIDNSVSNQSNINMQRGGGDLYINIALDVDYYTYSSEFNSDCYAVLEWCVAILAGVSECYMNELNVGVQTNFIHVWETINDPYYYLPVNSADFLYTFRDFWNSTSPFTSVDRDVAMLLTNYNIGGRAYLDELCNTNMSYAVSGVTENSPNYESPTSYTYGLNIFAHELGHNIGSRHTHDCVWDPDPDFDFDGGYIDNCVIGYSTEPEWVDYNCISNLESVVLTTSWEAGTIMSYCLFGGNVDLNMEFHPIVKLQALIPGLENSCISSNVESAFDINCEELLDVDNDGIFDGIDNCPNIFNVTQADIDGDNIGDVCDNCPNDFNITQSDNDNDGAGNTCDNCYSTYNPNQEDIDNDGVGDVCDNCIENNNTNQSDVDEDGIGDACDECPNDSNNDNIDEDAICGDVDNCYSIYNPNQEDIDNDGIGDACDNCIESFNTNQSDIDEDGIGDACDVCPNDPENDIDGDTICGDVDNCPEEFNTNQEDEDNNNIGDVCDCVYLAIEGPPVVCLGYQYLYLPIYDVTDLNISWETDGDLTINTFNQQAVVVWNNIGDGTGYVTINQTCGNYTESTILDVILLENNADECITTDISEYNTLIDWSINLDLLSNTLSVILNNQSSHIGSLKLFDINGKLITNLNNQSSSNITLNTSTFANGMYIVEITSAQLHDRKKIVINR